VVLVTAHTGTWDMAARALSARLGVEVLVVMQREADARARELHDSLRMRPGVRIVHVDHPLDSVAMLRHLHAGGVVAIQIDRVPAGVRFLEAELFGGPFRVPEGPFLLAGTAQSALLPVFSRRCGYFDYEVVFGQARWLSRRPASEEMKLAAAGVAEDLARFVRAHPNDWFHFDEG
jgi:KDO2-lipid IV(A) lauroyltransferase